MKTNLKRRERREGRVFWGKPRPAFAPMERYTPEWILSGLGRFDLDPACGPLCPTITARRRMGPKQDWLRQKWSGRVWLNPPFNGVAPWVDKMIAHGRGTMILFCKPQAGWFQRALKSAGHAFFFTDNVRFKRPDGTEHHLSLGICLVPFGAGDLKAIREANFRGVLMRVV